jgi:hypothetical protein
MKISWEGRGKLDRLVFLVTFEIDNAKTDTASHLGKGKAPICSPKAACERNAAPASARAPGKIHPPQKKTSYG